MAVITVTFEDTEDGCSVSWKSSNGLLPNDGTQAEQCAFEVLRLLAKAGGVPWESLVAKAGDESN